MKRSRNLLLIILWVAVTAPFTLIGYGSDPDSWRVANAARGIWQSGEYIKSRSTGFPLFEFIETPMINIGQWYLSNFFVLVCGVSLLAALFYISRHNKLTHPVLSILAFAFLPVIVKNSSSTMDYIPALSLLVWAYALMLQGKWVVPAILIGIACGFRPTSGLFVIPLCVYAYLCNKNWSLVLKVFAIALCVGAVAYSPALLKYGILWDVYGDIKFDMQTRLLIGGYNILHLFGIIQSLVVFVVLIMFLRKQRAARPFDSLIIFHFTNILVWFIPFIILPDEPEYLLPIVPSVIFLLDQTTTTKTFALIAILFLSYHFVQFDVLGGESGIRVFRVSLRPGFTVEDVQDRLFKLSTREVATAYHPTSKTLLMFGSSWITAANDKWIYDAQYGFYRQINGNLYVSEIIRNEEKLKMLKAEGFKLVIWRGAKWEYTRSANNYWQNYVYVVDDLSALFGRPIKGKQMRSR